MKKLTGVFVLCVLLLTGTQVLADTISILFGDNNVTWPGYTSSITTDTYGTPDFLGGTATVTNGYLTNLTFNVKNLAAEASLWPVLMPGDLFIDKNNDKVWDYVVNLITTDQSGNLISVSGDNKLYAVNQPLNGTGYLMSSVPGYGIRDNQPVGYEGGTPIQTSSVNFSGWPTSLGADGIATLNFTFGAQDIFLGSNFSIGWEVNCANDVLYETMNNPVPEPATLLLLGSGLIGLAGYGRKKFTKKETVVA